MQRIEIDCQTKQAVTINLTQAEIDAVNTERQGNIQKETAEIKRQAKKLVVAKLAELREMRQNRDIFSNEDIDNLQLEIDELKGKLQ